MPVVRHARQVVRVVGGDAHHGWLPLGAAAPLPTPELTVAFDVQVRTEDTSWFLEWTCSRPEFSGDLCCRDLGDALDAALDQFGIEADEWDVVDSPRTAG